MRNLCTGLFKITLLKNTLTYLSIILFLASCDREDKSVSEDMPLLYSRPQKIELNTGNGYVINSATGDSIQPVINSFGDTLKTGVKIPARGRTIHPESVARPKKIAAGKPRAVSARLNEQKIKGPIHAIPLDKNALKVFRPGIDTSSFVLVNSTGDTIPTGVPVPVRGKVVECKQPQPVEALSFRMKDNASFSLSYLDVSQGLNSSNVVSLLEDSQGNLWFGTAGGGVTKYNGETFTRFTKKEGLSNDLVFSIVEDSQGNLWFGTWGGGVSMYNGEYFTHYTEKEGLSNNYIWSLLEDRNGNLWFGTWGGGVCKLSGLNTPSQPASLTHFTGKEGLCNNYVRSIMEDSQGNIWFGTNGGGVSMYNGKPLSSGQAEFIQISEKDGLSSNSILSILEDSKGNLWFGTDGAGVSRYNGKSFIHLSEKEGLRNDVVWSMKEDGYGNIWFGTNGGGVSKYNGQSLSGGQASFTHYTENEGLSNNYVWSILEDRNGNLWFGTHGGGVSRLNDESFIHFTEKEGLLNKMIWSIEEDSRGNLWFGSDGGGVCVFNGLNFSYYTEKEGLGNNNVRSILEDSKGNLWFGTGGGGVSMFDGKSFTNFTTEEGLSNNIVWSILEDSKGNMWFGTWGGGVSKYDGESFTHYTEKEGLSNNNVRAVLEDRKGNLWFGTYLGGVSMYDGESFTYFTEKEGLSDNYVRSIIEDSRGYLWFGTFKGGVTMYDGESFTHFTRKEGLSTNIVQSILEDSKNNIWISTEKGINMIAFESDSAKGVNNYPVIYDFNEQDGLKGLDFYQNSALLDNNNHIWWGSSKSLVMLDIHNFKIPDKVPVMQLDQVDINDQFIDFRNSKDIASMKVAYNTPDRCYNYPLNPELPYNKNHLTFHFAAIDWSAPDKIEYSHRMEGLHNSNWSIPTSEAKADYRNLPFGTYTFIVRAVGGAQKWSEPFEYTFTILPPWWNSWWARGCYVILTLLIIAGIAFWRTASMRLRQKDLQEQVDNAILKIREQKEEIESQRDSVLATNKVQEEQKRELEITVNNLKLTQSQLVQSEKMASLGILTAGIAHELNNPINFVSGNVNPLRRDVEDLFQIINKYMDIIKTNKLDKVFSEADALKEELNYSLLTKEILNLLEGIEQGANRTSKIVKGLRSFSRMDEEKWQFYDIHEGIDSTLVLLQNKIKNRIQVRKEYGDFNEVECYPSKLNQVFMNILTNSIQAIEDEGEIFIQTISTAIGIKIIIKDSGIGMSPEVLKHIFEPFFTTKDVGMGTGLGLSISYGIIEQHNGNIDVISHPGKGTEFIISLPKTQTG